MVEKGIHHAMVKKTNREREPQDEYLNWDQLEEGQMYNDDKLNVITVVKKSQTETGKHLVIYNDGSTFNKPALFKDLRLKRRN
ncbi:MAG: hypothetical protein RG740_05640 [Acholeplasmataceae bacterium]|nr:hypothetical protein [Acholeplasmataceae bacterium]